MFWQNFWGPAEICLYPIPKILEIFFSEKAEKSRKGTKKAEWEAEKSPNSTLPILIGQGYTFDCITHYVDHFIMHSKVW